MPDEEEELIAKSAPPVQVIYTQDVESSEEPPMEEWSSLMFDVRVQENIKRTQHELGLYDPGSGEICTKYEPMSASSMFRHPYYNYPGIVDPGIKEALLHPVPKIIYPDDGQELYMNICKETNVCPIRKFQRQLLEEKVDLKYYGIDLRGFRPLAMALKLNRYVEVLDLTDNWIDEDGCYHLGEMLAENITLKELNVYGCKIGSKGAKLLLNKLHLNRTLQKINLSRNQLEDSGMENLTRAIYKGCDVANINVSYNKLSGKSAAMLAEVLEINNKLTHLDMSWNSMLSPNAIYSLCVRLSQNLNFQELNLSWNALSGLRVGNAIKVLLKNPNIRRLDLSNNNFKGLTVKLIGANLPKAVKLEVLDLSYNPMLPDDAVKLVTWMKDRTVKLQKLFLDNIVINEEFLEIRQEALKLKFRRNAIITHGVLRPKFVSKGFDIREILLNRADALCRAKKSPVDIALIFREMHKNNPDLWNSKDFYKAIKKAGAPIDDDVLTEIGNIFAGPKAEKTTTVNMNRLIEYINRKWPDRQLPPTPPPQSPQEVTEKKKKGKGKKK